MQKAIIFDIDETIAHKHPSRGFREYDKVALDTPIEPTLNVLKLYFNAGYKILFVTSRREICRLETIEWLEKYACNEFELFMRPEKQSKKEKYIDSDLVKLELYEKHIKGIYDIEAVFEDRKIVKEMWVKQGLWVFDTNQNNLIY